MGLQRFDLSYSVSVIVSTAGTLIGLGMVYAGYGVVGYVLVRVVFSLMAGPAYWFLARQLLPEFRFRLGLHRATLRRVRSYVGYGMLNRVISSLVSRLDQTLIGVWLGIAMAGVYAVPFMIVNSLGYMIAYMLGFIFPMASELHGLGQMDHLRNIFTRATRFTVALASLVFFPLLAFGDLFLVLWVPSIAEQASGVLHLLLLAAYVSTLMAALTNSIVVGLGLISQFTIYATVRGLVLGVSCVLLIPLLGLEGAGWALLVTSGVDVVYMIIVLRNYLQISPATLFIEAYLKPMALGVVLLILAFLARPLVVSWIGLGMVMVGLGLFYFVTGYRFGVFGETEKRALVGFYRMAIQRTGRRGEDVRD